MRYSISAIWAEVWCLARWFIIVSLLEKKSVLKKADSQVSTASIENFVAPNTSRENSLKNKLWKKRRQKENQISHAFLSSWRSLSQSQVPSQIRLVKSISESWKSCLPSSQGWSFITYVTLLFLNSTVTSSTSQDLIPCPVWICSRGSFTKLKLHLAKLLVYEVPAKTAFINLPLGTPLCQICVETQFLAVGHIKHTLFNSAALYLLLPLPVFAAALSWPWTAPCCSKKDSLLANSDLLMLSGRDERVLLSVTAHLSFMASWSWLRLSAAGLAHVHMCVEAPDSKQEEAEEEEENKESFGQKQKSVC